MYSETPAQLVAHLTNANGWWRDTAQRLLILKQDKSVVPALQQMARGASRRPRAAEASAEARGSARFHALWTLEGLGALDANFVREAMKDANPRMRVQAIRASETLYKAGDKSLADDYRALTKDADPNVVIQAMLTANLFKLPDASDVIKAAQAGARRGASRSSASDCLRLRPASAAAAVAAVQPRRGEAAAAGQRCVCCRVLRLSRRGRHGEGPGKARRQAR